MHNKALSRDPLYSTNGAYIIRKNFPHTSKINNEIMWLHAHFGIFRDFHTGNRNDGIWAPDGGVCELTEQTEKCELPDGAEPYSWGKRDKVSDQLLTYFFTKNNLFSNCKKMKPLNTLSCRISKRRSDSIIFKSPFACMEWGLEYPSLHLSWRKLHDIRGVDKVFCDLSLIDHFIG